jgi:predicted DsbA family dithiol-disulfide isomerase
MARTIVEIPQHDEGISPASIGVPKAKTAWHWFDFTCPFCYVARSRSEILSSFGLLVVELPFQAHPEIPMAGIAMGPRSGEMYERLEREARNAGLLLRWPPRLPNSRYALAVAEWVRRYHPTGFSDLYNQLFLSHFGLGEDVGDAELVDRYAAQVGADMAFLHGATLDGSAIAAVDESELAARRAGVAGTPAWLVEGRRVDGLQAKTLFEQVGREITGGTRD